MIRKFEWRKPFYVTSAEHVARHMLGEVRQRLGSSAVPDCPFPHHVLIRQLNHWAKCAFRYPNGTATYIYMMWEAELSSDDIPGMGDVESADFARDWMVYLVDTTFWPTPRKQGWKHRIVHRGRGLRQIGQKLIGRGVNTAYPGYTDRRVLNYASATLAHVANGGSRLPGVTTDQIWTVISRDWYKRNLPS